MWRFFFFGRLNILHIFGVTNNVWLTLIIECILYSCFSFSLFLLFFLHMLLVLIERTYEIDFASFSLLRYGLGALLQQMDGSSLFICTQMKYKLVIRKYLCHLRERNGTALSFSHQSSETSMVSLA